LPITAAEGETDLKPPT